MRQRGINALGWVVALGALVLAGCSGSPSPYDYIPIEGTVAYEDGTPLPKGGFALKFYALDAPQVEGMTPRPAQANVDATGKFEYVTSYKHADGLIPGQHRVVFFYATDDAGKPLVPREYAMPDSSPLVIDTADAPLEITVPKP
ncbi:MAG: hypothetical protein CMJ58_19215 [Planctomycetaceae bacterium]|nr:hypothetical protein [Planctomycetaceae bacterium]